MPIRLLATAAALALWAAGAVAQPAPGQPLRVGLMTDFSGPFAGVTGPGSIAAAELAVADGQALLPGRRIELLTGDFQNKADVASALARKWIDQNGVSAIADIANSAAALAVADVVAEKDRVFLATAASTTALTGSNCRPTTVHWTYDTYMQLAAVVPRLIRDGGRSWFFITPDYAYGHDAQAVAEDLVKREGGAVSGSVLHPVPMADFSSYLLEAASSDAQVVALVSGGADVVNAVKQSAEFGLADSGKKIVTVLTPINTVKAIGLEAGQKLYVSESFYWNLDDATRAFAERFRQKTGQPPNMAQAGAYAALMQYFRTVARMPADRAASGRAVVAEMKAAPIDDALFGPGFVRADGRFVHGTFLFQVKQPAASTGPWDLYDLVQRIPSDQVVAPMRPECEFKVGAP